MRQCASEAPQKMLFASTNIQDCHIRKGSAGHVGRWVAAASAWKFLDGLLGNEPRKTGWMRAEVAGDPGPWHQQAILGRGRWDAEALRDIVRDYALETLADEDSVLVIDETGFLKQGNASCGVPTLTANIDT